MIVNLQGEINSDMVKDLIDFYNQGYDDNEIYLNSQGGNLSDMVIMIDMINKRKKETVLIGYEQLSSAAFILFYSVECKISIIGDCFGMFHQAYSAFNLNSDGDIKREVDKFHLSLMAIMQDGLNNIIKNLRLSKSEVAKFKKGEDVYFTPQRLVEFTELRNKQNKY